MCIQYCSKVIVYIYKDILPLLVVADITWMGGNWAGWGLIALKYSFVTISSTSTAHVIQCQQTEGP